MQRLRPFHMAFPVKGMHIILLLFNLKRKLT